MEFHKKQHPIQTWVRFVSYVQSQFDNTTALTKLLECKQDSLAEDYADSNISKYISGLGEVNFVFQFSKGN
jgi:hypothetical protein